MSGGLAELLVGQGRNDPGRTLFRGRSASMSYGETLALGERLARHLMSLPGIGRRRSLAVSTETAEYTVPLVFAAVLADISLVFVPLCREPETVRRGMDTMSVAMLVSDEPALVQQSWCLDLQALLQSAASAEAESAGMAAPLPAANAGDDAGFVFQTSGTLGEPKWVHCGYRQYATVIGSLLGSGRLEHARGQSVFLTPPLYHSYGLSALLEYAAAGATVFFPTGNSPLGPVGDLRQDELKNSITAIEAVPYFYVQLARLAERFPIPGLDHLGLGGGALDARVFGRLRAVYPAAGVSVRYGMTETPSVVSHKLFRPPLEDDWSSSGRVLPVYEVGIVDASGRVLGAGEEGEIVVGGDCVGRYAGRSESRLFTGDTGYINGQGELVVTGRKSLYIKNRGFRISPEQVESVILSLDHVEDCRVRMLEDRLVAEVVYDDAVSAPDILDFVAARLPHYAVVDEIRRVEAVPRTPSGKLRRY